MLFVYCILLLLYCRYRTITGVPCLLPSSPGSTFMLRGNLGVPIFPACRGKGIHGQVSRLCLCVRVVFRVWCTLFLVMGLCLLILLTSLNAKYSPRPHHLAKSPAGRMTSLLYWSKGRDKIWNFSNIYVACF